MQWSPSIFISLFGVPSMLTKEADHVGETFFGSDMKKMQVVASKIRSEFFMSCKKIFNNGMAIVFNGELESCELTVVFQA
jgi:hypothetical protein